MERVSLFLFLPSRKRRLGIEVVLNIGASALDQV
jgi:hypothetical protein